RTGQGALYYTALLDQWVRMNPIAAEDNGLKITRDYYVVHERLDNGQLVEDELPFTGTVKAGETVRVKLTLEVTRAGDVEHVNFEDRFPAGFEVVERERRAWGWWSYWRSAREVHDDRVVFFASQLNRFGGV
ncbi:MAG TPA: hypothetical protein DEA08_17960, partial [Planctomycetes bacterium]|nr:hypothetical protein [Planctomycetota bacterium]